MLQTETEKIDSQRRRAYDYKRKVAVMKISCTPISVKAAIRSGELDQQKYFELLAATGADATDILDTRSYSWFWKEAADVASVARRVRDCNLKIAAYAVGNSFTFREPEEFDRQVGIVLNGIHEAAEVGAPFLRIFGGYHKDLPGDNKLDYAEGFRQILRGIETVLPEARKCGVVLTLENHGRTSKVHSHHLVWHCCFRV